MPPVRVELRLRAPSPSPILHAGTDVHVPGSKQFAAGNFPEAHVAVAVLARRDEQRGVGTESGMVNLARMRESANERVVAHAPDSRETIRAGHDHQLFVRAELS